MIRRTLLVRWGILAVLLALVAVVAASARRLGLSEIVVVGAIVGLVLLANGLIYVVGQVIRGYLGEG